MKLKINAEIVDIGGLLTLVPVDCGDHKIVLQMNETTADIISLLKEDTTEDAIVAQMMKLYDAPEADIRRSVAKVLDHLRQDDLLDE